MEFFIILPGAKIDNLPASTIFSLFVSQFMATIDNTNSSNQLEMALKMPFCGNDAKFCGKLSEKLLPQPSFEEFHKSFQFHVCDMVFSLAQSEQ